MIARVFFAGAVLFASAAAAQDAVEQRLQTLERRILDLEKRNAELEGKLKTQTEQAEWNTTRLENVENRAGTIVKPDISPTLGDPNGQFSFKVRGVAQADWVYFNDRTGGYAFNNGTAFRRARLGVEGTAFRTFAWRFETDFAGNAVNIQDAYLSYTGVPRWTFTAGQQKAPYSLESNTSDNYNTFLERGMVSNAFGTVGAERRIGLFAQYIVGGITAAVSLTGDNESSARADTAPNESWGVNGRFTWAPINDADLGRVVHLAAASYWRTELKQASGATVLKDAIRFSDRPNVRVDGGNLADTGVITDAKNVVYFGGEALAVYQSFGVQAEYGRARVNRTLANLPDITLDGGYVMGSWFLTGEYRPYRNGTIDRLRPRKNFDPSKDGWGAFEIAARYDTFDFTDTPVAGRTGNKGHSTTVALNWYFNPNSKLLLNWVRFAGTNTPLDPVGNKTAGDAYAARLHLDW